MNRLRRFLAAVRVWLAGAQPDPFDDPLTAWGGGPNRKGGKP